jgi:hypothetical protein
VKVLSDFFLKNPASKEEPLKEFEERRERIFVVIEWEDFCINVH